MKDLSVVFLAIVPLLYGIGFLSWAFHSLKHGLGLLPLNAVHYLASGTVIATMVGFSLLTSHYGLMALQNKIDDPRVAGMIWLRALILGLSTAGSVLLWTIIHGTLPLFALTTFERLVVPFAAGLATAFTYSFLLWMARPIKRVSDESPGTDKTDLSQGRDGGALFSQGVAVTVVTLVLFVTFAGILLPTMNQEFGGGREREASFDLDPNALSPDTINRLWPGWNATKNGDETIRTPEARVLFVNSDVLLVRPLGEDSRAGALFELQRSSVRTIIWS